MMKFINKSSVIGFTLGAIISPLIMIGGIYLYIQTQLEDLGLGDVGVNLSPPYIPVLGKVDINWTLKTTNGMEINLEEEFKDQVVFINFWATWCPPCIAEMPTIEKLYQRYKDKIGFAMISNEDIETIADFKNRNKYTFPVYQIEMEIPEIFNLSSIPITFIISPDRKIALKHVGGADWNHEDVINFLDELINDKSDRSATSKLKVPEHLS
jgi:thiol-disulfide isomerase/thioredoxin